MAGYTTLLLGLRSTVPDRDIQSLLVMTQLAPSQRVCASPLQLSYCLQAHLRKMMSKIRILQYAQLQMNASQFFNSVMQDLSPRAHNALENWIRKYEQKYKCVGYLAKEITPAQTPDVSKSSE